MIDVVAIRPFASIINYYQTTVVFDTIRIQLCSSIEQGYTWKRRLWLLSTKREAEKDDEGTSLNPSSPANYIGKYSGIYCKIVEHYGGENSSYIA